MKIAQALLRALPDDLHALRALAALRPNLLLVFGDMSKIGDPALQLALCEQFPATRRIGCSTAGEIGGREVHDGALVATAVRFAATRVDSASTTLHDMSDSHAAGLRLGSALATSDLKAVLVFGQGIAINGSALCAGLSERLGDGVGISGGLAGDAGRFSRTCVLDDDGAATDRIVAVGLYGDALRVAHGCFGGWHPFGPSRKVTRSTGNRLFELDGEAALTVYRRYLGDYARDLPASGLLFPLQTESLPGRTPGPIRTILGADEGDGSLTLAGDIEAGGYVRLMHAHTDSLVDGAETAAQQAFDRYPATGDARLALLVSCVGRKLVMGGRTDEEIEAVAQRLGTGTTVAGFYSYGEISALPEAKGCLLHNQTMTITWIGETVDPDPDTHRNKEFGHDAPTA